MKHWKRKLICFTIVFLLCIAGIRPLKSYWREWSFFWTERTAAEEAVMAFAERSGQPYRLWPEELIALLERNPETEDFVLSYPAEHDRVQPVVLTEEERGGEMPLFLQWDKRWGYLEYGSGVAGLTACGPVSLSMVAFHLTGDERMTPDNMIRFALEEGYCSKGNGSSWTLISEGAGKLGLTATELPLVEKLILGHLEKGDPIICVMGPGDFTATGHFIVLRGLEDGLLLVNDPNSRANSEKRWALADISDQIKNLWVIREA